MNVFRLLTIFFVLAVFCGCTSSKADIESFFCPEDRCEARVVHAINESKYTIDAAVYSFTSNEILEALVKAQERGVTVRFVGDYLQSKSAYSKTSIIGGRFLDTTMHNKFVIIDNSLVITGSFNWTSNADEKNAENIVFIFDKETAKEFGEEFLRLWVLSS